MLAISDEFNAVPLICLPSLVKTWILLAAPSLELISLIVAENVFPFDKIEPDVIEAFDDFIVRIRKRFPVKILFYPVSVQGPEAAGQISKAIKYINNLQQLN